MTHPWSQNKTDMAKAIWVRLLGCFGESLIRKFGPTPPQEWVDGLGMLSPLQQERGLRRLVFGWKGGPPSLPEFMRLCRSVGSDEFEEGPAKLPALPPPDTWEGDVWASAANRYLMGHIAKRMATNPKGYGKPASYEAMRAPKADLGRLGLDEHNLDASSEFVDRMAKLVAAKNTWAADMRDLAIKGEVPAETQKAVWREYLARAEA